MTVDKVVACEPIRFTTPDDALAWMKQHKNSGRPHRSFVSGIGEHWIVLRFDNQGRQGAKAYTSPTELVDLVGW